MAQTPIYNLVKTARVSSNDIMMKFAFTKRKYPTDLNNECYKYREIPEANCIK